jgi:hypothetical protein
MTAGDSPGLPGGFMKGTKWRVRLLAALIGVCAARDAAAKVIFTGYADFRMTPQSDFRATASPSALASIGRPDADLKDETRTFNMDSIGVFATTSFNDNTDFLMDVTYKRLTSTTADTSLQYAYLHHHADWGEVKAGRVPLPIGLYNENRFYPFQRHAITPPLFQTAVLGLPIVDQGVTAVKEVPAGPVTFRGEAFIVNGYGASSVSTATFRPGIGVSGALTIVSNLQSVNNNSEFAYGGKLGVLLADRRVQAGVSGYDGPWSADGKNDFSMMNVFLSIDAGPVGVLTEWLRTDTDGDAGVVNSLGVMDWKSEGAFLEASVSLFKSEEREVALFGGTEETVLRGKGAGASGRERFLYHKAGVSWRMNPSILLKTEANLLDYRLPTQAGGGAVDDIHLTTRSVQFGLTLTF